MLVTVWGTLAPDVASMIVTNPDLGRRLSLAPAWVIHATAAFIQAMLADDQSPSEIAGNIANRRPRDLLLHALPNAHPRIISALKRVGDTVRDLDFYRRLNELLHGDASKVVIEATTITSGLLDVAGMIAADPVLLAAYRAIDESDTDARSLAEVLRYLRSMQLANSIEALPIGAGWQAIVRRCQADLAHAEAPPAPFGAPAGWTVVKTLGQLFAIGERMENCVGGLKFGGDHHLIDLITGRSVYMATKDGPPVLAAIRNIGPSMWTFGEVSIRGKRKELTEARAYLRDHFAIEATLAGHSFFVHCPISSLSGFTWKAEQRQADAEVQENDLEEVV